VGVSCYSWYIFLQVQQIIAPPLLKLDLWVICYMKPNNSVRINMQHTEHLP